MPNHRARTLGSLLAALLFASGCSSWRAQQGPPATVVPANARSTLRITRNDHSTLVLTQARVEGDSIVGMAGDPPVRTAVASADVQRIDARRISAAKTGGLTLGALSIAAAVAVAAVTAAVLGGWN